jgi:hypothetical protein
MKTGLLMLGVVLISAPGLTMAGDYSGGNVTPQSSRESNTHSPGMGIEEGSLDNSIFGQLDRNGDQKLTGDELQSYDSGPEGKLGDAEVKKNRTLLKEHDLNGDGTITMKEFNDSNDAGQ